MDFEERGRGREAPEAGEGEDDGFVSPAAGFVGVDDCFRGGCRPADPSDVLVQELVEPPEAVLLDDELELVQDAVVVVWVGQCDLVLPERIQDVGVGGWDFGGRDFFGIVVERAELIWNSMALEGECTRDL